MFCAQRAPNYQYRHDRVDWHTNSMPLAGKQDTIDNRKIIQNLNGTDSPHLNQNYLNGINRTLSVILID